MNNQRLHALYTEHEATIKGVGARCGEEMEGPFLIAPNDAYWNAKLKVAFVGQETYGWTDEIEIDAQMEAYSRFNLGEDYYSSPFWNVIRKLETALTGANYNSAWLNLNRYDEAGGKPSWENQVRLGELDFLLIEELKIVAADVVILFTGPYYDDRVNKLFGSGQTLVEGFSLRQLCQLQSPSLNGAIFRTYHPNYLRRSGLEPAAIEAVVNACGARPPSA